VAVFYSWAGLKVDGFLLGVKMYQKDVCQSFGTAFYVGTCDTHRKRI